MIAELVSFCGPDKGVEDQICDKDIPHLKIRPYKWSYQKVTVNSEYNSIIPPPSADNSVDTTSYKCDNSQGEEGHDTQKIISGVP